MGAPSTSTFDAFVKVYAVATLILALKFYFMQFFSADFDAHPKEDKPAASAEGTPLVPAEKTAEEKEWMQRKQRSFANDMENIPLSLVIFWAAFLLQCYSNASGNGSIETTALASLFVIYVFARVFFTICYLCALQPFRSLSFATGIFATIGALILLVIAAFNTNTADVY